ncbi:ribonuclease domain-containing protein [Rhodanobacter sp. Col0626]|uniref:ribonuclease domain-containing protein n=1 Tax=Rhodanobacter sp. Col0626 TaxID=3415679 RepID=UPI003CFA5B96
MRQLKPLILLVIVVLAVTIWNRHTNAPSVPDSGGSIPTSHGDTVRVPQAGNAGVPSFLPAEAREMLDRIARGGPFEHSQDGVVFGNYEGLLPKQPRGYYHEYTVETPGARNRGARRIITGGTPPVAWYYTDDHYRSFRRFEVTR